MSWYRVELSKVVEVNPKYKAASSADLMCPVAFVPMAAVSEETCRIEDEQERPLGEVLKGYTPFRRDDVIVAKITPCFENGKVALVSTKHDWGFGSTEFHVLRADKRRILPKYLYHLVRSNNIRLMGVQRMTGSAGQKRVPKAFWEQLQIPLPALSEQKRIAAILDKADALRAKRRAALAKLDTLLQATFLDMFGDPVTNPMGWDVVKLSSVADVVSGVTKSKSRVKGKETITIPYMRVANVQDGRILTAEEHLKTIEVLPEDVEKYLLKSGDILLTEGGDPDKLGRGGIWRGEVDKCIHQNHVFRVRINQDSFQPEYLSALIGSPYGKLYFLKAAKQTTGIASINRTQLRAFPVLRPSIGLQEVFRTFLVNLETQKFIHETCLVKLDSLFHSLQQRAFKGEL